MCLTLLCVSGAACARQTPPPALPSPPPPPLFSDDERAAITTYWTAPGRYKIGASPDAGRVGPWVVRLTPEGSSWFLAYHNAVAGKGKTPPTQTVKAPTTGPTASWEPWVQAKLAYDKYQAQMNAQAANLAVFPSPIAAVSFAPPAPGSVPPGLLAACGNPPALASVVAPLQYTVTFDDADTYSYVDNAKMPDRYAYYRFSSGVTVGGAHLKSLPQSDRDALFQATNFAPEEQRVWEAVSALEGGFDAVQTYDTGYISVGFIQFISFNDGKHDLSHVLLQEKADQPAEFQTDFRRFGIDVRPDRSFVVVDPETGAELEGPDAVMKVIDDKRLLAAFQRAGRRTPFRLAQIRVAKADYWPEDDPLTVTLPGGAVLTGKIGDVVTSEAGIATLLDRKINVGNCRIVNDIVARTLATHKCPCKSLAEAVPYEREIIAAARYRTDFLKDATLTQPGARVAPPQKSSVPKDAEFSQAR
jgi:hypothetical protein